MNSLEYWKKREDEARKHYIKDEKEYEKEIKKIYQNMIDQCNKEINSFYGKYAEKEGITMATAKRRVSKLDIEAYERKAERYVKDASLDRKANGGKTNKKGYYFSKRANEEMRLYNATMKINRLEMLKAYIGLELIKGHDELDSFMSKILKDRTMEELERQAGLLGKSIGDNAKAADAIVNASFKNATFSDRIWLYQGLMKNDLDKMLQQGMIQGKNPRVLAKELEQYVNPKAKGGARYNAERLMRTEMSRVRTEAQKQSFERNGFEMYMFIPNSDSCHAGICEDVKNRDVGYGKGIFLVKDMQPGLNAPPMHPNCRCSIAAHEDSKDYKEWLEFLANGGSTEEYNAMKQGGNIDINKLAKKDSPKTIGEDEKRLISLGIYNIQTSGGYADRKRTYVSIENLEIKQSFSEMVGQPPLNNGKFTKKYIAESIKYQEKLKKMSLWAAEEYKKELKKAKSEGAKILFAKKIKEYEKNAKDTEEVIKWLKSRKVKK